MVKNAKIENVKCDILGDFQTLWIRVIVFLESFLAWWTFWFTQEKTTQSKWKFQIT